LSKPEEKGEGRRKGKESKKSLLWKPVGTSLFEFSVEKKEKEEKKKKKKLIDVTACGRN